MPYGGFQWGFTPVEKRSAPGETLAKPAMSYNSSAGTPRGPREDGDMESDMVDGTDAGRHARWGAQARRLKRRRGAVLAAVFVGLGLLAAACSSGPSSPGVAGASSGATTTTTDPAGGATLKPTAAQAREQLDFSHCMQTHGEPSFPDPSSNGSLQISGGPNSALNPNSEVFKKAQSECQKFMPAPTPAQKAQGLASGLKLAKCMRAHGITDFPDPNSSGQLQIKISPGSDLNPDNPQFQAAQKACGGNLPRVQKGSGSGNQSTGGIASNGGTAGS
jgi:hypothetical protein